MFIFKKRVHFNSDVTYVRPDSSGSADSDGVVKDPEVPIFLSQKNHYRFKNTDFCRRYEISIQMLYVKPEEYVPIKEALRGSASMASWRKLWIVTCNVLMKMHFS